MGRHVGLLLGAAEILIAQPLIGRSRCRTQRRAQHAVSAVDATVEAPHNVCAFARVSG